MAIWRHYETVVLPNHNLNETKTMQTKNRMNPYQHQLRIEASKQNDESIEDYIGRLHGLIARGHDGARQNLNSLKNSFAYQMYQKGQRARLVPPTVVK